MSMAAEMVLGYSSAKQQAAAQARSAEYGAAVARNNQILAAQYAQAEKDKGQVLEDVKRQETAQRISGIRAAGGASGLDVNSGTSLDLQSDTARLGEFDALTIRDNAARAAYGYQVKGVDYANEATLDMMRASDAKAAGTLAAWSSVIGTASKYASRAATMGQGG